MGTPRHFQTRRSWPELNGPWRFVATVVASALLSVFLQRVGPKAFRTLQWHWTSSASVRRPVLASLAPTRIVPAIEQYRRYFDEAMPLIRGDQGVRMIKVTVPAAALDAQRNGQHNSREVGYALHARGASFPALAVTRNALPFLESMRVTYIDLGKSDTLAEQIEAPLDGLLVARDYLIVPDVSGTNEKSFKFERSR